MLLRFAVTNHLSIRHRQELSFIPAKAIKDNENGLIDCPAAPDGTLLPTAAIYGANASGKSNIVDAIHFLQAAVGFSQSSWKADRPVAQQPFALKKSNMTESSVFEIDFVVQNVPYHYEFKVERGFFVFELLIAFPMGRPRTLFERNLNEFTFGKYLRGQNINISRLVRPNSLFLSAALQNSHDQLSPVASYLGSIAGHINLSPDKLETSLNFQDGKVDPRIISILSDMGTGVINYRSEKLEIKAERTEIAKVIASQFDVDFEFETVNPPHLIELAHAGEGGELIYFDLAHESVGTRRLLSVLDVILRVLDSGSVVIIDELGAHLHTQACEVLLGLFAMPNTNPKGAQLIATTHDTNLLNSKFLRRDQIWFTEKDREGATDLYPLTDIRTRKGDDLEKGYLQGRYGAIPFAGSITDLLGRA